MNKKLIFSKKYFEDIINVIKYLDHNNLEKLVDILVRVKKTKGEFSFLELVEAQEIVRML